MRPQPASIMSGRTAWQQLNVPVRFTARMRCHFSAVMLRNRSNPSSPALLTRTVGPADAGPHLVDSGVDLRPVGHVDRDARRPVPPDADDLGRGRLGCFAVEVEDGDGAALGRQPFG